MDPVLKKLRFKEGDRVYIKGSPAAYAKLIAGAGVQQSERLSGPLAVVHMFFRLASELRQEAPKIRKAIDGGGIAWLSYPKAKALETDLNRDIVREIAAEYDLDTVAQVAIDETWSALRVKPV